MAWKPAYDCGLVCRSYNADTLNNGNSNSCIISVNSLCRYVRTNILCLDELMNPGMRGIFGWALMSAIFVAMRRAQLVKRCCSDNLGIE